MLNLSVDLGQVTEDVRRVHSSVFKCSLGFRQKTHIFEVRSCSIAVCITNDKSKMHCLIGVHYNCNQSCVNLSAQVSSYKNGYLIYVTHFCLLKNYCI